MLGNDVAIPIQELLYSQHSQDQRTNGEATEAQASKEVHGTRKIFQKKLDGQDIEQHVEGASQAIMRSAGQTGSVANRHFGDARAVKTGKRGNESMQFPVEIDFLE